MDVRPLLRLQKRLHKNATQPYRGLGAKVIYRVGNWWLGSAMARLGGLLTPETEIGDDLDLPHGFSGVFIAGRAKIGNGVRVFHGVTIGATFDEGGRVKAAPIIGNSVFIGAGANIIGACVIGDGAKIGAGVTLVDAVIPPGAIIINKSAYDLTNKRYIYPQD